MKAIKNAITATSVLLFAVSALGQDRKPIPSDEMSTYVVSAKAGIVSIVEGAATITHAVPFAIPEMLLSGDALRLGDTVKTGGGSRAEILLDPGCYLRLGEASEFVFLFDGSSTSKIKLSQGSAVVEASTIDDVIVVATPKANFEITRVGLYRFNASPDGKAEVAVRKGRVLIDKTLVREGKRAFIEGGVPTISALNKNDLDDLDNWSRERAMTLIATNKTLSTRVMKRSLAMGFASNSWIYDPFCGCYTFLPGTLGFASPYGWSYSVCNPYWYTYPWWQVYNGSRRSNSGGGKSQPGGGSNVGGHPGHGHPGRGGIHPPPPRIEPAGRGFEPSHSNGANRGASLPAPSHEGGGKKH